jgi:hypothetical protein
MKNITRVLLFVFIFLVVSTSNSAIFAGPTVVRVTIDPAQPLPLSTLTFTAILSSNETIDDLRLIVQECREDLCFAHDFNVSMEKITNDTYKGRCTLIEEEATQIKYHLKIVCNETWYNSNITLLQLAADTKKNTSQDSHDPISTPGFEVTLIILSIVSLIFFNHWRRKSSQKP